MLKNHQDNYLFLPYPVTYREDGTHGLVVAQSIESREGREGERGWWLVGRNFYILPASQRDELPMFIILPHLSFDQIFHELSKWRLWISCLPVPPSCDTNFPAVYSNELLLNPGASLELVPVGGDNPGEGVTGDHKAGGVLELPPVGQSPSSRSE